jgi:hypothetical protein
VIVAAMYAENMLSNLLEENRANFQKAESLVAGLSNAQVNWRTESGKWSIGQNLDHLNIIYAQDLDTIASSIAAARAKGIIGSGPFRYGWLSTWFVKSMEPPPKRKFKAPKFYAPSAEVDVAKVFEGYRKNTECLADLLVKAEGLDLARAKTPMVMPKWAKMPLGARLSLLVTHDRRHLWQAEQIRNNPNFPR